jgi:DNA-binding GntR family transcriptional regulator
MRVKTAMYDEANSGKINIRELMSIPEDALAVQYGVSRDTIRRAKRDISEEIVEDKNLD